MKIDEAVHATLHKLWSSAVGTPTYVKDEWKEFERVLQRSPREPFVRIDPMDLFLRLQKNAIDEGRFEMGDWAGLFVVMKRRMG